MRYSQRPPAGDVVHLGKSAGRDASRVAAPASVPPSPPRTRSGERAARTTASGPVLATRRRILEVVLTWSGGEGVDLVKLVIDDAFRRPRDVRLESGRRRLALELDVDARPTHTVEILVAFVGESRTDLALRVYLDGMHVGDSPACEDASHRWLVRWTGS